MNKKERSESSTSFQMDPNDIEHVTHHSQVYTVVSKPFKQSERDPRMKPFKSSNSVIEETPAHTKGGVYGGAKKDHVSGMNFPPARPPPPNVLRKQHSADSVLSSGKHATPSARAPPPSVPAPRPPTNPANQVDIDYADYAEVDDSPSSSADNSPFHRPSGGAPMQIKQQGNHSRQPARDSDMILLDVHNAKLPQLLYTEPTKTPEQSTRLPPPPVPRSTEPAKTPEQSTRAPPPPMARSTEQGKRPPPPHVVRSTEMLRENKKLELHQKYSKIREEILRKQGQADPSSKAQADPSSKGQADPSSKGQVTPYPNPFELVRGRDKALPYGAGGKHSPPSKRKAETPSPTGNKILSKPTPKGRRHLHPQPSYSEVEPDFEIIVEPVPNRISQTDADSNIWMQVKYPTMPKRGDSMGQRSSSSSNLTGSDYYSNLAELQVDVAGEGSGSDSLGRRRHSFSEGEERIIIRSSTESR